MGKKEIGIAILGYILLVIILFGIKFNIDLLPIYLKILFYLKIFPDSIGFVIYFLVHFFIFYLIISRLIINSFKEHFAKLNKEYQEKRL